MSGRASLFRALLGLSALVLAPSYIPAGGKTITGAVLAQPQTRRLRTVRVLPLGDSITHGVFGSASYRYPLWELLRTRHSFDFVGRVDTVANEGPGIPNLATYPDYYGIFDADHEGYSGARTEQIRELVFAAALEGRPDIVLLQIGTNDVGQLGAAGLQQAATNLPQLIDGLRAANPAVRIVLAQIPPIGPGTSHFLFADLVSDYNLLVADIAADKDRPYAPIELIDNFTGYDLMSYMQVDGLHPNELGEQFLAERWEAGFEAVLQRPGPPPLQTGIVADLGFEEIPTADGEVLGTPEGFKWNFGLTKFALGGILNPTDASYVGADGAGTPRGADGEQVLFLANALGPGERAVAFQTLPTTLLPERDYSLSVSIGNRLPGNPFQSVYGGYRIELLSGSRVLVAEEDAVVPPAGGFASTTLSYDSTGADPSLFGKSLTIRLWITGDVALASTDFDRIRLTVQ